MDLRRLSGVASLFISRSVVVVNHRSITTRSRTKSLVDDLGFGRGVVLIRAATLLRSIETKPLTVAICSMRTEYEYEKVGWYSAYEYKVTAEPSFLLPTYLIIKLIMQLKQSPN